MGRSGQLENTVFAILDPKGSKNLIPPSRGPRQYGNAQNLAAEMDRISVMYPGRAEKDVPKNHNLRLALNIAACDSLPLVISVGSQQSRHEDVLKTLIWNEQIQGRAIYAQITLPRDRALITGLSVQSGIVVVRPNTFGTGGEMIGQLSGQPSISELSRWLSKAKPASGKETREHIRQGREQKVYWKTQVPITDPEGKP